MNVRQASQRWALLLVDLVAWAVDTMGEALYGDLRRSSLGGTPSPSPSQEPQAAVNPPATADQLCYCDQDLVPPHPLNTCPTNGPKADPLTQLHPSAELYRQMRAADPHASGLLLPTIRRTSRMTFRHGLTFASYPPVWLDHEPTQRIRLDREGCNLLLGIHQWISDENRYRWGKPATCSHWDPHL